MCGYKIFILSFYFLGFISMGGYAQNNIDYIDVYAINFSKTSKYGIDEKDLTRSENFQFRIEEIDSDLELLLVPYLGLYKCASSASRSVPIDLRLIALITMQDGTEWILGFSYMDYMIFAETKLEPRNDQLLLYLSRLIKDKSIRKSIQFDVKLNKK